jgi:sRNA-binding protein
MTNREFLTAVINGTITADVTAHATAEIAKLDARNAKRKTAEGAIKEENKPIADAITAALANGAMISKDLANAIGVSTPKVNGVAGEMVKLGMLTKTKVKVKGGEATEYALVTAPTAEVAPTEEATEDTATDEVAE